MPSTIQQPWARRLALIGLIAISVWVQLHFLNTYPQPGLFGDPVGFLRAGRNLLGGFDRVLHGQSWLDTFISIRGSLYFAGVGLFYGVVDKIWPSNIDALRRALILANVIGFLGLYSLAQKLARGSSSAGLIAVCLAILHPSFSTHLGRVYPDPITGALFVWSAALYVRGLESGSRRSLGASSFLLSCGLLVRPQILAPVLLVLVTLLSFAALRSRSQRSTVLALLAGLLPAAMMWTGLHVAIAATADRAGHEDDFAARYGWTVFTSTYPQGFWQYFETDGWEGPYRLRQEPFYAAFVERAAVDPTVMTNTLRGYEFAAAYALRRPVESALLMLDNAYRIFDRPTNGYRWDYPLPISQQVLLHRLIVVAAIAQLAWIAAQAPSQLPVFLIPLCLATIHAFTFPWPRYSQSSLLILIAASAAFAVHLPRLLRAAGRRAYSMFAIGVVAIAWIWVFGWSPEGVRALSLVALFVLLPVPFVLVAWNGSSRWRKIVPFLASLIILVPAAAHQARDVSWHQTSVALGGGDQIGVRQDISLSPEAVSSIRGASEAFVVFDLLSASGETSSLSIGINGVPLPGSELIPTMPRLPESTTTGKRDPRTYRQWWAVRLPPNALKPGTSQLRIEMTASMESAPIVLFGDRFRDARSIYEGPSFGDFPKAVALKLEYDGDYRIPIRRPLSSSDTISSLIGRGNQEILSSMSFRIRVVTLSLNTGSLSFLGEPATMAGASWGFFAYSGSRGEATVEIPPIEGINFPLGSLSDFERENAHGRLCYRTRGEKGGTPYGGYVVTTDLPVQPSPAIKVSFKSGMSVEAMYFHADPRPTTDELNTLFDQCGVPRGPLRLSGAWRVLDATRNSYPDDTGKWRIDAVY